MLVVVAAVSVASKFQLLFTYALLRVHSSYELQRGCKDSEVVAVLATKLRRVTKGPQIFGNGLHVFKLRMNDTINKYLQIFTWKETSKSENEE